jgi:uncharacterized protein
MKGRTVRFAVAACLASGLAGCYTVRVNDAFWLRPRAAPAASTDTFAARLGGEYRVRDVLVHVAADTLLPGIAAVRDDARATVLFFGSDDFVLARRGAETAALLTAAAPVNVVMGEYPGFGQRPGPQSFERLKRESLLLYDAVAADTALYTRCVIVHGHSLGSFLAAHVAAHRPVCGLVLQSSATNPGDWMKAFFRPSRFKWWARPAYPFLRVSMDPALAAEDNEARVRMSSAPLLVLVGGRDDVTPPAMSRRLWQASPSPESLKRLVELPGADHENVLRHPGFAGPYAEFTGAALRAREEQDGRQTGARP